MDYTTFVNETADTIRYIMGKEAEVRLTTITKNNNVKLDGLTIKMEDENISPTIYLNDYYKSYLTEKSIDKIAYEVIAIYEENKVKNNIDVNFFTDFCNVKDRVAYKLVNYEKNKEMLEDVPYIRFMDLVIVFYCLVSSEWLTNATILIHNSHLNMWKTNVEELYELAQENTAKLLTVVVDNIETILRNELGEDMQEMFDSEVDNTNTPMYVISNNTKVNGAACILYKNVLKDFAKVVESDLYVLPSSVHEIIVIPKFEEGNQNDLKEIVKETNDNHVQDEEILSYSVYEYVRNEDKLKIVI
ncbi:MAG: DUF5688 family protein [Lachnotalea sp.]